MTKKKPDARPGWLVSGWWLAVIVSADRSTIPFSDLMPISQHRSRAERNCRASDISSASRRRRIFASGNSRRGRDLGYRRNPARIRTRPRSRVAYARTDGIFLWATCRDCCCAAVAKVPRTRALKRVAVRFVVGKIAFRQRIADDLAIEITQRGSERGVEKNESVA